jgi:hypothetical protein
MMSPYYFAVTTEIAAGVSTPVTAVLVPGVPPLLLVLPPPQLDNVPASAQTKNNDVSFFMMRLLV